MKEKSKKKFIGIIVVFLVLLAVVGVIIYLTYNNDSNTNADVMSIAEAKQLVNQVCEDMGWIEETVSQQSGSVTKAPMSPFALNYEDWDEDYIDYRGYEDFVKAFILQAKFAFDDQVEQEIFYVSSASYTIGGNTYHGSAKFYFKLLKNILELHMFDSNLGIELVILLDNNYNPEQKWTLKGYMDADFQGNENSYTYFEIKANTKDVFAFSFAIVGFDTEGITEINSDTINNVAGIEIYDCNISIHKKLNVTKSEMTDEEITSKGNIILTNWKGVNKINFEGQEYEESTFLESLYIFLGYIEE